MKVGDLMDGIFEAEATIVTNKKTLKAFFNVDVLIQGFPGSEPEEDDVAQQPEEPAPEEQDVTATESTLYEDIYKHKATGEEVVPAQEVDNIQTLEDLLDYLGDIKMGGKPVISEPVEEIILALAGVGTKALEDIVNEGDKIYVDIDYGKEKPDSVGIRANKQGGSAAISLSMKKDNRLIPGEFNLEEFNKQLVFYRNSIFGE
jgi:hypothetical protein